MPAEPPHVAQVANNRWAAGWLGSGLAHLTGLPGRPPDSSRANVLRRAAEVLGRIVPADPVQSADPAQAATLLAGRAGLRGLTRNGRISAGGATRLMPARDGWVAITLSRPDDLAAVPALLQADEVPDDPWPVLQRWAATRPAAALTERAGLLDIPAAALNEAAPAPPRVRRSGAPNTKTPPRGPAGLLVADLSSMWAGPLCGQLLARAGATVVKVESPRRPDGTRTGERGFFDWINGAKLSYCVDFGRQADELRALLAAADIVIEGSRPAALARRRLGPDDVPARPGRVWLRITGYGEEPDRPAFGDDAAVAGGLVGWIAGDGPVFCADAIADPLTGLEAAAAVTDSLRRGGGELIHVAMADVAATYAALPTLKPTLGPTTRLSTAAPPPQPPPASPAAAGLGADNDEVRRLVSARHPC